MRPTALRLPLFAALSLTLVACGEGDISTVTTSVAASDQSPATPYDVVAVDEVVAAEDGWIVIYQDANGGYGRQLGHAAVNSGTSAETSVTLSRTCIDGETLHALLHVDRGQQGDFEFPGVDEPVLTEAGDPVGASFIVTVADQNLPSLLVKNQALSTANQIALTQVVATAAGRVLIRAQHNNAPGDIIGSLDVEEGVTGSEGDPAVVTLDREAVNGELLYAVLQRLVGEPASPPEDSDYEDEFDLSSNGPLMVLFTVSVDTTSTATDQDTSLEEDVTAVEDIGPDQDTEAEDAAVEEDVTADEDTESSGDTTSVDDSTTEDTGPSVEDVEDVVGPAPDTLEQDTGESDSASSDAE
jgi:hypothetical protein